MGPVITDSENSMFNRLYKHLLRELSSFTNVHVHLYNGRSTDCKENYLLDFLASFMTSYLVRNMETVKLYFLTI
jgi:hypothetical protein